MIEKKPVITYPVIRIDKSMKLRLLKACAAGEMVPSEFPELFAVTPMNLRFMSDEDLDAKIKEYEKKLKTIKG